MKGSHSRLSHQPGSRYSNVAHVQGAMITDADLTEAGQIHQDRDEAQSAAFAGSGVPAEGGMVTFDKEGGVQLQPGTVFAQGKQGEFRLAGKEQENSNLRDAFARQMDLPHGPALTQGLVYVDLWERHVMAYEDPYLADAGLHGAETSYRTRTMVQLKCLPDVTKIDALPKALSRHPAFKARGTATLSLQLAKASTELDACDPCADLISIDKVLPNALVRVELVSVERNKSGEPTAIRLAWSSENAEAVESIETRSALERDNAVYEYFSATTEAQLGYFPADHVAKRGAFTSDLRSDTPSDPTLPKDKAELGYTHVRRWDGMVKLGLSTRARAEGPSAAISKPRVTTAVITLETEFFTLTLAHDNADMIAGDYWLVELRRYAPEDEQALLNGNPLGQPQPPLGPMHHFCPIGISNGETLEPLPDVLRRRLSFPTLADLPASHIEYDANPECDLLGETETVQQALDRVCEIDATHVAFNPSNEACETLSRSRSVDDALNALCRADDNKQLKLMMRTMMDWGVVCGLSVELGNKGLEISSGVALDRSGVLHEMDRTTLQLESLDKEQLLPDPDAFEKLKGRNVEICLSLGIRGKQREYFLSPASLIYGQNDLTLSEQVNACLDGKGSLTQSKLFEKLPDNPEMVSVLTKLHVCMRNDIRPLDGMTFTSAELKQANSLLDELIEEYMKRLDSAGDPLAQQKGEELRAINAALDKELGNSGLKGTSGQLSLVGSTLKYAAIMKKDEEFRLDCLCSNVVPDCPAIDEGWSLIPLACVDLANYTAGKIAAKDACMMCCRKQANTPRSHRYYNGDMVGQILAGFKELCAAEQLREDNGPSARLRQWLRDAGPAPWDPPQGPVYWPIKPTYGGPTGYRINETSGTGGLAVLNEWQRGYNTPILDVSGMKTDEAHERLKGAGFEVIEILTTTNIKQLLALAGNKPLLNRRPQSGDEVVLLTSNELAVEFVVTKQKQTYFGSGFFGKRVKETLKVPGVKQTDLDLGKLLQDKIPKGGKDQPAPVDVDPNKDRKRPLGKIGDKTPADAIKNGPGKVVIDKKKPITSRDLKGKLDTQPAKNLEMKIDRRKPPKAVINKADPKVVEKKVTPKVVEKKVTPKVAERKPAATPKPRNTNATIKGRRTPTPKGPGFRRKPKGK